MPYRGLMDAMAKRFLSTEQRRTTLAAARATVAGQIITYCGSGISACCHTLALTLIGVDHVAVYDGSMMNLDADPSLSVVTGLTPGSVPAAPLKP